MNAYLSVVILTPTDKEKEDGGVAKIVSSQSVPFLAKDDDSARVKALRHVGEEFIDKEERLVVRLVSFR